MESRDGTTLASSCITVTVDAWQVCPVARWVLYLQQVRLPATLIEIGLDAAASVHEDLVLAGKILE